MGKYYNVENEEGVAIEQPKKKTIDIVFTHLFKVVIILFIVIGFIFIIVTAATDWTYSVIGGNQGKISGQFTWKKKKRKSINFD